MATWKRTRVIEVRRGYVEQEEGFVAPAGWAILSIEYIGLNAYRITLVA